MDQKRTCAYSMSIDTRICSWNRQAYGLAVLSYMHREFLPIIGILSVEGPAAFAKTGPQDRSPSAVLVGHG